MEQLLLSTINKNYKLALEDILVVEGDLKNSVNVHNVRLTSINNERLVISFNLPYIDFDVEKVIFFPEIKKESSSKDNISKELLDKFINFSKSYSLQRGYSNIQIKEYVEVGKFDVFVIFLVLNPIIALLLPNKIYFTKFLSFIIRYPKLLDILQDNLKTIIVAAFAIHAIEYFMVMLPKLKRYRVPNDIFIEWTVACLLEGYGPIKRFNQLVSKIEKKSG